LLLVQVPLVLKVHKANKGLKVIRVLQVQMALMVQQVPQELLALQAQPDLKVQQAQMELTEQMVLLDLRDQQVPLELQVQQEPRVQQEQLALTVPMEPTVQLRPLLLARLRLEPLAVVQALLTAVLLLLLFSTSRSLGELLELLALKVQLDQMLLSRWGQLLSVQAVLQQELSVTTPQKTGLRATTAMSG
tara:strand:- start:134 stop:703 length:570 start_codon:yes stop_codon:yes gene_type:complete